jgi:pimeloyl-ACP methyl ester carboxylesterase
MHDFLLIEAGAAAQTQPKPRQELNLAATGRRLASTGRSSLGLSLAILTVSAAISLLLPAPAAGAMQVNDDLRVRYKTETVGGVEVFYREAGPKAAPTVLLLHGFPTSSHMFRTLLPALADKYHVIAPDLPGFGFTRVPAAARYAYNFANLTETIAKFTEALGLKSYAIYVFDYGAPVGYRLALRNPERISAIISQNANGYEEGLSPEGWRPVRTYWQNPTLENREALRAFFKPEATKWQYTHGVADTSLVGPESYTLDQVNLDVPGNPDIQLDLFGDYQSNVALYPKFQEYFRTRRPPLLAVWGKNDPFFLPEGARAYKRDNPEAEVHLLDTGHFALETHGQEIATLIHDFLDRKLK